MIDPDGSVVSGLRDVAEAVEHNAVATEWVAAGQKAGQEAIQRRQRRQLGGLVLLTAAMVWLGWARQNQFDYITASQSCQAQITGEFEAAIGAVSDLDARVFYLQLSGGVPPAAEPPGLEIDEPALPEFLRARARLAKATDLARRITDVCYGDHPDPTPLDGDRTR